MSIKIKDLAKEFGVPEDDVFEILNKLFVDFEDENSKIDDKIASLVRIKFGGSAAPKKKKKAPAKPKKLKTAAKAKAEDKKSIKGKSSDKEKPIDEEKPKKKTKAKAKADKDKEADLAVEEKDETEKVVKKKKPRSGIQIIKRAPQPAPEELKPEEPKAEESKPEEPAKPDKPIEFIEPESKAKKSKKKKQVIEIIEKGSKFFDKKRSRMVKGRGGKSKAVTPPKPAAVRGTPQKLQVQIPISIRDLAVRINLTPSSILQYLMSNGVMATINQAMEEDIVREVMTNFGYELELYNTVESLEKELIAESHNELPEGTTIAKIDQEVRPPVVTFMGHVDHGKTSLLDYIRNTMVTKGEKGGITQHIGAYKVETSKGAVTFLDTPGHAAFTAMRARGANATDVVVLVVAADDGVMPQTKEAIDHARAAGVPIVVAVNKCDLPGADPDRVRTELQKEGLAAEAWGGDTIMEEVSAITGEGVDHLVEMLMLESEMLELKANPALRARGVVVESKKTAGQGVAVTLLVQNGTLRPGDIVLCGSFYGRIKAMVDYTGSKVESAGPATPVEVLGLQGVPEAGDEFFAVKDEKKAKTLALLKQNEVRNKSIAGRQSVSLEDFHSLMLEGGVKELNIILKADVQGSIEALQQSLLDLVTDEVKVNIIHSTVGNVNESDIMLAVVSNAVIIGFHVKVDSNAELVMKRENIDVKLYEIIYEAIADVKAGMEGLLEPELREIFQGSAQVLEVFSAGKAGKAAGCSVTKGTIHRKDKMRIKRAGEIVYEGDISALKRFKDDVKDVREGFECGISIKGFTDIKSKDTIETFIIEKIARRLEK